MHIDKRVRLFHTFSVQFRPPQCARRPNLISLLESMCSAVPCHSGLSILMHLYVQGPAQSSWRGGGREAGWAADNIHAIQGVFTANILEAAAVFLVDPVWCSDNPLPYILARQKSRRADAPYSGGPPSTGGPLRPTGSHSVCAQKIEMQASLC